MLKLSLLEHLWKSYAPSKVITKGNLFKWVVFSKAQQLDRMWCPSITASEDHLFGTCPFACGLWYKIFKWFGFSSLVHPDPFVHVDGNVLFGGGACKRFNRVANGLTFNIVNYILI
jgi:hypothetical protein